MPRLSFQYLLRERIMIDIWNPKRQGTLTMLLSPKFDSAPRFASLRYQPTMAPPTMSDKRKLSNAPTVSSISKHNNGRMKAISISRFIFPLFLTVAFMACLLTFSISDGLSSLEQSNPVLLALRDFHHHADMGPPLSSLSMSSTSTTDPAAASRGLGLEQSQSQSNSPNPVIVEPIQNPELSDGHETFSACMLVMDDNHRLVEWLVSTYRAL